MERSSRSTFTHTHTHTVTSTLASSTSWLQTRYLINQSINQSTRHRASTSMYSLTFCVRFLLPERHQWKARIPDCRSNVENAPSRRPVAGGPAATLAVCGARFWGRPRRPSPAGRRRASPAGNARRPRPAGRSHYAVISRDGRKLGTRVRVMLP